MTPQYDTEKLEYSVILDRLLSFTRSDAGYNLTKLLRPSSSHDEVLEKQQETFEAIKLLSQDVQILADAFPDIRTKIYEAQRGGLLTTFELLEVGFVCREALCSIRNFLFPLVRLPRCRRPQAGQCVILGASDPRRIFANRAG